MLGGFGSDKFGTAIENLQMLDDIFMREVGELDFIGMNVGTEAGNPTIEVMNWVFSQSDWVPGAEHIPFSAHEDPNGDMEKARGTDLIRTEDNIVDYFNAGTRSDAYEERQVPERKNSVILRFHSSETEKQEVCPTKPTTFQVGDLVEVGLSVVASPVRGKRFRLRPILRYITMEDSSHTQASAHSKRY